MPVLEEQDAYKDIKAIGPLPDVVPDTQLPIIGNTYAHGFAMLTLGADAKAKVDYFNTGGGSEPFFSEIID